MQNKCEAYKKMKMNILITSISRKVWIVKAFQEALRLAIYIDRGNFGYLNEGIGNGYLWHGTWYAVEF